MNSNNKPGEDCNCNCCINRRQIEEDKNNYYVKIYVRKIAQKHVINLIKLKHSNQ